MANIKSPKGYVYILTNPSFREDWIKIGKSTRPVDVRSKELDNTAVPLPFQIFATMETSSYNKVEQMLHRILEGTNVRIRKNREFFNVKPEVALDAFFNIAELLPDAEVFIKGEKNKQKPHKHSYSTPSTRKNTMEKINLVEVHSLDNLIKGARYSLDGTHFVSMASFCFTFIKQFLSDNPSLTFSQLEALFPKTILDGFQYCGVVAEEGVLEKSSYPLSAKKKAYHYGDSDYLLRTSDGVNFYTTTQWVRDSFKKVLSIVENYGYRVYKNE